MMDEVGMVQGVKGSGKIRLGSNKAPVHSVCGKRGKRSLSVWYMPQNGMCRKQPL
jgi:hypothetical protein